MGRLAFISCRKAARRCLAVSQPFPLRPPIVSVRCAAPRSAADLRLRFAIFASAHPRRACSEWRLRGELAFTCDLLNPRVVLSKTNGNKGALLSTSVRSLQDKGIVSSILPKRNLWGQFRAKAAPLRLHGHGLERDARRWPVPADAAAARQRACPHPDADRYPRRRLFAGGRPLRLSVSTPPAYFLAQDTDADGADLLRGELHYADLQP